MLDPLRLLKYVSSFSEGRVRIRHPALRKEDVARAARERISTVPGVYSVENNTVSGSVLILYDSARLSRDDLIRMGLDWGGYLDAVQAGKSAEMPR